MGLTTELERSIAELVEQHAAEHPDAIAIEDGERRVSYAELDLAGNRIAAALRSSGVEDEEPVAVCLPRSWEAVCAFLGALRAGAAYVPVNPAHPAERQRRLLELAGARVALTGPAHGSRLPAETKQLDAGTLALAGVDGSPPPPAPGGDRLAYVLFTSGSTGTPKGVEVTHGGLVNLLRSGADILPRREDTGLHQAPLEFDMSALEIWGALLNGARLVVSPPGYPDPEALGRLIAERGVTIAIVSPGMLNELIEHAAADLAGMRLLITGGDVFPPQLAAAVRTAHPTLRLLNAYGPTEATIVATSFEVGELDGSPVPIGHPLAGALLYVVDEEGAPVPDGEPGELWIGGPGVARGYRNDPERTAERFSSNPFGPGMVYRTGDRVRRLPEGALEFLSRIDDQAKIGGQRVEPAEVERSLETHPEVAEAAVIALEDVPGHRRLAGYVSLRPGGRASSGDLRRHLASRLPPYMVPGAIVPLDGLPRSERGKLDRSALPAPPRELGEPARAPSDPRVAAVVEAMAEVLHLDAVGPDEDFFDLGGTSLLAIQLAGRLRRQLDAQVEISAVFEARTAAALAAEIERRAEQGSQLPPLQPRTRAEVAPVSGAQRRALLFGRMNPDSIAYQFAAIFRLEGELDPAALEAALAELLRRHEILRSTFELRGGEPVMLIHPELEPSLETIDLRGSAYGAWQRLVRERVREQIDPGEPPLIRWTLARLGETRWALLQREHHLIHDGWSFTVLADELAELYSAEVEGRPADLGEPAIQFQDYTRWERDVHSSEPVARQIDHWRRTLDPDPPAIELPGARPRPARESFRGGAVRRRIDSRLEERLRRLARDSRVTLFMVALAAFVAQLRRYSGHEQVQVGSGVANRRDPNAERLVGMIVNTVGLRFDLAGDPSVGELLDRVRAAAVDAYANADAPFDVVVDALRPPRDPNRSPLVQTLFSFHDSPRGSERWSGLRARLAQGLPNGTAKADLNVVGIAGDEGGLTFIWEHSDLIDDATADRLAGHHLRLLEQFVDRPDARLSELDLRTREELDLLADWRENPAPFDREATVPALVGARARRDPAVIAVSAEDRSLTYGELVERAAAVCGELRERGVQPGDRVGVLLGRSSQAIVAQLGILTAGAAYVPLDPQHPPARIARVLAGAGAEVVLTDAELRRRLPVGVAALEVASAEAAEPGEPAAVEPDDLAYLVYTSGSTGEPKGVEVTHSNVVRLIDDPDYAELGPGVVMLYAASPAFDATTFEIWGPLANGGTVVPLAEQPSPDAVAAAIEAHGVTTLFLTTGLFHELVDRRPECLGAVRQLLAGGDVLSPDHMRRALAALPADGRLTACYGPTETTTFATTHDLHPGDPVEGPIPIGRPIQATSCEVVDPTGRGAPIGAVGELAIGGDGVSRGYRGDPDLTAARFEPDPERPGGRRYLTGDRARWRPDGVLEFLGRADRQVKVRGVRVEPAEIEEALRSHPAVADVAAVPFERAPGDLALAAYFVAAPSGAPPDAKALRTHALARLPTAMVPTAWVGLEKLPLTANGKLDRGALPPPGPEHLAARRSETRPSGKLERRVVACFEEVLGVRPVGVDDDFFELGGHSLLAVSLFAELEKIAGQRLPLAMIFEAPTPRGLAGKLAAGAMEPRWDNLVALKAAGSRPPLFAVAGGDGNVVGFGPLARSLSAEQPLYALQPSGLDGRNPLDQGIDAMANRYLAALRSVQPHGPYLLAGRCAGAVVAYEMAQRLRADGEEVPLLAALDSDPPPPSPAELAPGIPYDHIMESAWLRERAAGGEAPDPEEPDGPTGLATWLGELAGPGVTRYLHEAWRWREDLQEAWPDPLGAHARSLAEWGWDHGPRELSLSRALLVPQPPRQEPPRERLRRLRLRGTHKARAIAAQAFRSTVDALERQLGRPLPNAQERLELRVMAAARRARATYRAEPWPGRVLLVASSEYHDKLIYPAWEARARGGVERRLLPVGHIEMLRDPGARLLAGCLEEYIAEVLAR